MGGIEQAVAIRLLGAVEIAVDGRIVEIGSAKQRALLAALALEVGSVVSAERLIEVLWGDDPPDTVAPTLRGLVARLRRAVVVADEEPVAWLGGRTAGYVLDLGPDQVDLLRFERLAAAGRDALARSAPAEAARALAEGLALWRGPALDGLGDCPILAAEARRLAGLRLGAVEDLAEAELGLGRPGDALARLEPLVAAHPMRERAWGQLVLALYRQGRQGDALAAYRRARQIVSDELGVDLSPALRELESRILAHDPALTPAAAARSNLPSALSSFVGRAVEISEVIDRLAAYRLVTLLGPGGAGKTRLSLQVAGSVRENFPDGVWFVELAPLRDPALVASEIAAAVGLDANALASATRPFLAALCEQLRTRRMLVVLDNCEHLIAAAAQAAHEILSHCPDLTVLASSREVLAVPGEAVVRIGPLSLPEENPAGGGTDSDAVALFCERAQASSAGFRLTVANAAAVVRICRRLDGSPLALELAAARIRLLGAEALAERLDDRFRLLAGGPRTVDPRHRSLQAAVDWSHDLLAPAERVVLRRLSVFPSDFGLAAAEAVTAGGGGLDGPDGLEVLGILGRLADKSLLSVVAEETVQVRYRLLETLREYAAAKLDHAGETESIRDRHRDHFTPDLSWSDHVVSLEWMRWCETEAANVWAALEWARDRDDGAAGLRLASSQWVYWMLTGTAGATAWMQRAVTAPGCDHIALRVHARCGLAMLLLNTGAAEAGRCAALMREAVDLAVEHDDDSAAWARMLLGQVLAGGGRLDEAELLYGQALEAFQALGSRYRQAFVQGMLAHLAIARGDLGEARRLLEQALALSSGDDDYVQVYALGPLALLDAVAGEQDLAHRRAAHAVRVARDFPGRQVLVMALTRAAETALVGERFDALVAVLDELLGLLREVGSPRWVAETLEIAAVVLAPDRPEAAATLLGSADALRGSLREEGRFLAVLAHRVAGCGASTEAALGTAAAERRRRGAAMHLDEVLAYARAEVLAR
ncbi:MAG: ATP-binding protein [Sporichthyaceae bacterium]